MISLASAQRVVIKVGSVLLVDASGHPDFGFCAAIGQDVAKLREHCTQVLLVSSGAVALGRAPLGLTPERRLTLELKQAAAAAGQARLVSLWAEAFSPHRIPVGQVLLTRDDTEVRRRWLNARGTLDALLRLGAVPVINENDTVATEELRYGDNDRLAARVAQMVRADYLVLLSDVDGLYTGDPRRHPNARHVAEVEALTPEMLAMAGGVNDLAGVGSGGMASKLAAAAIAREAGCTTLIAAGKLPEGARPLHLLSQGYVRRTRIAARASPPAAYKAWIAGRLDVAGALVIDAGAVRALARGASLLPAGVVAVRGSFGEGDAVAVLDGDGREIARGLVRRDAEAARRTAGSRFDAPFGERPELIHQDDLVMLDPAAAS